MDFDAGNTSDPATAQACGSDTVEGSRDNNEPMQAGILGANEKSEEEVPTGQFKSPPSDGEDELQGATAAIVRSAEIPPFKPLEATAAEDSVLALQGSFREEHERLRRRLGEQRTREDREIERRQRRESEMQEGDVQPQQQQLAVPACSQQQLKYRKEVSE